MGYNLPYKRSKTYAQNVDSTLWLSGIHVRFTFNTLRPSDAYMHYWLMPPLVQIMTCRLFSDEPLSEPMVKYCRLDPYFSSVVFAIGSFALMQTHLKISSDKNIGHYVSAAMCWLWEVTCRYNVTNFALKTVQYDGEKYSPFTTSDYEMSRKIVRMSLGNSFTRL